MAESTTPPPRRRRRWVVRAALVGVVAVVLYVVLTAVQVVVAADADDGDVEVDAIVVLGAAQYDGTPSPALAARLDQALELYEAGSASQIVLTGSKQPDDRFTEAFAGFRYLAERGVPESALVIVDDGSSTYESLAAVRNVLRDEGSDRLLLVTDSYHNRRVQGIARELGMEPFVAATPGSPSVREVLGETARVAAGEVIGYRRLFNATG